MESVDIVTASHLLGICRQRIQQLIYANRVKGAFKTRKGWQIPLYKEMPQIIPAKRGVKGTWRLKPSKKKIIHINKSKIAKLNDKKQIEPVIIVRKGRDVIYGHEVFFEGQCRIVYHPQIGSKPSKHGGARVWIEVSETTKVMLIDWNRAEGDQLIIVD